MKQLMIIISITLIIPLFCLQDLNAQDEFTAKKDTIENQIRNQFNKLVVAAATGNDVLYRSFFTEKTTAQKENDTRTFSGDDAFKITFPALKYYLDKTIQVVKNDVSVRPSLVKQSIKIITIHTDTSHGIAIDNIRPVPKHMSMEIDWVPDARSKEWKIGYLYRNLERQD